MTRCGLAVITATYHVKDMLANGVDGSLPFPTFPRFCGQTFNEGKDKELGLACVRAYNDWMVEEWCAPSGGMNIPLCLIPLWDAQLAAEETPRNTEQGVERSALASCPPISGYRAFILGTGIPSLLFAMARERLSACI